MKRAKGIQLQRSGHLESLSINCELIEGLETFPSSDLLIINVVINIIPYRQKSINNWQERHCLQCMWNVVLFSSNSSKPTSSDLVLILLHNCRGNYVLRCSQKKIGKSVFLSTVCRLCKRYCCKVRKEVLSFMEPCIPLYTTSSCECGTSVFVLQDKVVPWLCQNELWCGNLGLWVFHRMVIKLKWQDIVSVYDAYYMKSSIFNDKCAIFLIFIALMCVRGFNNWCWNDGNFPEMLSTTAVVLSPQFAQVLNYGTWLAIDLAVSLIFWRCWSVAWWIQNISINAF